jgi:hypothetical protein
MTRKSPQQSALTTTSKPMVKVLDAYYSLANKEPDVVSIISLTDYEALQAQRYVKAIQQYRQNKQNNSSEATITEAIETEIKPKAKIEPDAKIDLVLDLFKQEKNPQEICQILKNKYDIIVSIPEITDMYKVQAKKIQKDKSKEEKVRKRKENV